MKFTVTHTNPKVFTVMRTASFENKFDYPATGSIIDTTKFLVTNPNSTVAAFRQYNALIMDTKMVFNSNTYANSIKLINSYAGGVWKFSFLDVNPRAGSAARRESGVINSSNTNGVYLYRDGTDSGNLIFKVKYNGSDVYSISTGIFDFCQFKINLIGGKIKLYKWINDSWVQFGTEQLYNLGNISLYMATRGLDGAFSSMSDIHWRDHDFTTLNPI